MAQTFFGTNATPSLAALDANFTELYGLVSALSIVDGALNASLNLQVGKAFPAMILTTAAANQSANVYLRAAPGTSGNRWVFGKDDASESGSNAGSNFFFNAYSDSGTYIDTMLSVQRASGNIVVRGSVAPSVDAAQALGGPGARWSTVYASTGTINTSDARLKTAVRPLTAAEIDAARDLAGEIGAFKFLEAVQRKGTLARTHLGLTVQRAMDILRIHGLDPEAYGFICHDTWAARPVPAVTAQEPTGLAADDGTPLMQTVVLRPARTEPAGDRYGFRVDELLLFVARGFDARLRALEAALA